jgi:hypothetical protein
MRGFDEGRFAFIRWLFLWRVHLLKVIIEGFFEGGFKRFLLWRGTAANCIILLESVIVWTLSRSWELMGCPLKVMICRRIELLLCLLILDDGLCWIGLFFYHKRLFELDWRLRLIFRGPFLFLLVFFRFFIIFFGTIFLATFFAIDNRLRQLSHWKHDTVLWGWTRCDSRQKFELKLSLKLRWV